MAIGNAIRSAMTADVGARIRAPTSAVMAERIALPMAMGALYEGLNGRSNAA